MIAKVIPALRLPPHFSVFDYVIPEGMTVLPGDLVRIPFRSKMIAGIVQSIQNGDETALKNISEHVIGVRFDIKLLEWAANAYHTPLPLLAYTFLPRMPKNSGNGTEVRRQKIQTKLSAAASVAIVATPKRRLDIHRAIVKDAIRSGTQVLILVAEDLDLAFLADGLRKDVPTLVTRSGSQGILPAWKAMLSFTRGESPVMIGTRLAALMPAKALGTIILDREEDPSHKQSDANPRYDAREIAEKRCEFSQIPLSIITEVPSIRVVAKHHPSISAHRPPRIINLKDEWRSGATGLISEPLKREIDETRQHGKISILLHNRKGIGGIVYCHDCTHTFSCSECGRSYAADERGLVCRVCGKREDIPLFCPKCNGPQIAVKKLGLTRIAHDITKLIPGVNVTEIARQKEHQLPPPFPLSDIVIGTEAMLHWYRTELYKKPIGCVGVILADSLWQRPEYTTNEEAFTLLRLLQNLAEASKAQYVIQTLDPAHRILNGIEEGPSAFTMPELDDRTQLGYPPTGIIIKAWNRTSPDRETTNLTARLRSISNSVTVHQSRTHGTTIIIKIPSDDAVRSTTLSTIGPEWTVDVNPRYIFD